MRRLLQGEPRSVASCESFRGWPLQYSAALQPALQPALRLVQSRRILHDATRHAISGLELRSARRSDLTKLTSRARRLGTRNSSESLRFAEKLQQSSHRCHDSLPLSGDCRLLIEAV